MIYLLLNYVGNSGGPVFNDRGEVIGVAFQSLAESDIENIGYVVPVSVIKNFLENVNRYGYYAGVCCLGVQMQTMENDMMRQHHGMNDSDSGILVLETHPMSPANELLLRGDVLLKIDNITVRNVHINMLIFYYYYYFNIYNA